MIALAAYAIVFWFIVLPIIGFIISTAFMFGDISDSNKKT